MNYGFVIDTGSCIGCHACSTACKSENEVPLGVNRTWVKSVESGRFPDSRRAFQVTRCNHCANPPCVRICPTGAMFQRDDGIVEFDTDACIGCKACTQACPYDAIYLDPESHTAAKCHFCSHRIDVGLEPACVVVCPEHAILAGDLDDPHSEIAQKLAAHDVTVRKPEQGTSPKLFYIEGNALALHPTATEVPESFLFADALHDHTPEPLPSASSAVRHNDRGQALRAPQAQGLSAGGPVVVGGRMAGHMAQTTYNAQHRLQWHWQIPAYLVTKHIAGGVFLLLALAALVPSVPFAPAAMGWLGGLGIAMTLTTLGLLVADLDRPDRFFYLLVRPQWRSWVARAAWILAAFSAVSGLWWAAEVAALAGLVGTGLAEAVRLPLAVVCAPLALMAAIYTAFLFAQAEGRDLWQAGHLPAQMTLHALLFGALPFLALPLVAEVPEGLLAAARGVALVALAASALTQLVGDLGVPHATEVARRANHALVRGKWRMHFWWGGLALGHVAPLALVALGGGAQALGALITAMLGHYLYNTAFVTAPQEVPNS